MAGLGSLGSAAGAGAGAAASGGGAGLIGALGPIGAGLQVLGAGFQIAQAIDAKKKQRDAERAAKVALSQAKSKLAVNRLEGVQLPLDAYEAAMRETTAQQMQSLEGLREADARSLAAGVGKLQMAGDIATERTRRQMEQAITQREEAIAKEQSRIDATLATLDLEEAMGAQEAAAQREEQFALGLSSGVAGLGSAVQTLYGDSDLYQSRQNELKAASELQKQGRISADLNARQARRKMLEMGYTSKEIMDLSEGKQLLANAGISSMGGTFGGLTGNTSGLKAIF
jgi:hypothetical protein